MRIPLVLLAGVAPAVGATLFHAPAAEVARPHLRVQSFLERAVNSSKGTASPSVVPASPPPAVAQAAPATPAVAATSMVDLHENGPAMPPSGEAMVSELQGELKEVKQHRTNIVQMQQALTADVALLRESSALQRVSATHHSRIAAQVQVRKTEQLVKDLSGMLRDSRADAVEDAKALLHEATEVRNAADALATEAASQLHSLAPKASRHGHGRQPVEEASLHSAEQASPQPSSPAPRAGKHSHRQQGNAAKQLETAAELAAKPDDVSPAEMAAVAKPADVSEPADIALNASALAAAADIDVGDLDDDV